MNGVTSAGSRTEVRSGGKASRLTVAVELEDVLLVVEVAEHHPADSAQPPGIGQVGGRQGRRGTRDEDLVTVRQRSDSRAPVKGGPEDVPLASTTVPACTAMRTFGRTPPGQSCAPNARWSSPAATTALATEANTPIRESPSSPWSGGKRPSCAATTSATSL